MKRVTKGLALVPLLWLLLLPQVVAAQALPTTLVVKTTESKELCYDLTKISKITFTSGAIKIERNDVDKHFTPETVMMSNINKLFFAKDRQENTTDIASPQLSRYRQGILLGITSSVLAALFTITNKKVAAGHDASTMLLYEMSGGFVGLSCLLPFYLRYFPVETIFPDVSDLIYLILLASVCTIGLYLLQIQVLKVVSAFTVNLTYNLEPVYSIILAMLFFHEARELNGAFYIGLGLIVLSVLLQTFAVFLPRPDKAVSS